MLDTEEKVYSLVGGALCLDFTNTVGARMRVVIQDNLSSYNDLVSWGKQTETITPGEGARLREMAGQNPESAGATLEEARAFRETLYHIFWSVSAEQQPDAESLKALNKMLSRAMSKASVVSTQEGFRWDWSEAELEMDKMLWPVARSAAELLLSEHLGRVRECAGDTCGWLFVDLSRNHSRHWCDMKDCGNRAKAKRYYARSKAK